MLNQIEQPPAPAAAGNASLLAPLDVFARRHIGPRPRNHAHMLATIGVESLDQLVDATLPDDIQFFTPLDVPNASTESEVLAELRTIADQNELYRSFIGMGYYDTIVPSVIRRNILENPGWYTQYTPYQPEIAQGRLEALLNFQTMVMDLTAMDIANASLLDEATAAAEAMMLALRAQPRRSQANTFFVSDKCHPQTIAVVQMRAEPLGINVAVGDWRKVPLNNDLFGVLVQYPDTEGNIDDFDSFTADAHRAGAFVVVAADLLALTLLRAPGEWGADVVIGSTQRFGVPLGYGGPHAAYMATKDEHKRLMPGRLVGVSIDAHNRPALRLALQTREQHIRRDRATSNICTAQVLLAIMAGMYAVYHGPEGLHRIGRRVRLLTRLLQERLEAAGYVTNDGPVFDTLKISGGAYDQATLSARAAAERINLRLYEDGATGVSLDEATTVAEMAQLLAIYGAEATELAAAADKIELDYAPPLQRTSNYLQEEVFKHFHSEAEMTRYIHRLQNRDLSLTHSMIPLGSCTMKLNATTEMLPITWQAFSRLHPFAPVDQAAGYHTLFERLNSWLAEITGMAAVSLQPNSGAQGEYTGLLVIRAYHLSRGDTQRTVCLIPSSAHGTNPASAVMAGMEVVVVACDSDGNVDVDDLREKAAEHSDRLAALMITYPSTHGVFELEIREICNIVHEHGGQVYLDGANLNAQVGLARPGHYGADVCHLNLHKTFSIPHGGGGPGMGPICVRAHLAPFLPGHPVIDGVGGSEAIGPVSAAPWGSASILPISYAYIAMLGPAGMTLASKTAILNANYIAARLEPYFHVLYRGANGFVAHECIIDLRPVRQSAGVTVDDVAKRLMDYGFHAPTMSWPVIGTLMIEPTESESLEELDRFCDAMIAIRQEIDAIEDGRIDVEDSPLRHAPHAAEDIAADDWAHAYSREQAAYPLPWLRTRKFWPPVGRIDNVYGDRNLVCTCAPLEAYIT